MHGRLVDNIQFVVEEICAVDLQFGHDILCPLNLQSFMTHKGCQGLMLTRNVVYWSVLHLILDSAWIQFSLRLELKVSKWWEHTAGNSGRRAWVSWKYLMWRTHQTLSFGTTRCIGIVRTMAILAHLTCLRIWCDEMLRYCGDNTYIIVIMIYRSYIWLWIICVYRLLKRLYLHCGLAILQRSKDYSDTTVFGWPTLWMSNRTFCSTLRFEAVRCHLYVESWLGDGTFCFDYVLYSE